MGKNKSVFLFGSARSGTTWLAEMLLQSYAYYLLFEPFNGFELSMKKVVSKVYMGEKIARKLYSQAMLCKSISPRYAPWVYEYCKVPLKYIFLVRDPLRVAESKARRGYPCRVLSSALINVVPDTYLEHHLIDTLEDIRTVLRSDVECKIIQYDSLLLNPHFTLEGIWEYIGLAPHGFNPDRRSITDSSVKDRSSRPEITYELDHILRTYRGEIYPLMCKRGGIWEY